MVASSFTKSTLVENGVAPDTIIATKFVNDTPPAVQMTRPLCVFPKVAKNVRELKRRAAIDGQQQRHRKAGQAVGGRVLAQSARRFVREVLSIVHAGGHNEINETLLSLVRNLDLEGTRLTVLAERARHFDVGSKEHGVVGRSAGSDLLALPAPALADADRLSLDGRCNSAAAATSGHRRSVCGQRRAAPGDGRIDAQSDLVAGRPGERRVVDLADRDVLPAAPGG